MIIKTTHVQNIDSSDNNTLKTYIINIIKLYVFVNLCAGLLFGIFQTVRINSFNGFIDGLFFGTILSLTTIPILIFLDVFQKAKCYFKYKIICYQTNQKRKFLLKDNYVTIFNKLNDVLNNHPKIEIYNKDMKNGVIEAVAKRSWKSIGEIIKVEFLNKANGKVVVVLSSKPKISLTMIDYCKNLENVEMIMSDVHKTFNGETLGM